MYNNSIKLNDKNYLEYWLSKIMIVAWQGNNLITFLKTLLWPFLHFHVFFILYYFI